MPSLADFMIDRSEVPMYNDRLSREYPRLADVMAVDKRHLDWRGPGQSEFYPRDEMYNPYPGKDAVEIYNPAQKGRSLRDLMFGERLHMQGNERLGDPGWIRRKQRFYELLPEQDKQWLKDKHKKVSTPPGYMEREPTVSELDFFRRSGVPGYAAEDGSVVINPVDTGANKDAVRINEYARLKFRSGDWPRPGFEITPEQRQRFAEYGSERDIRETIAARLLTRDPSAGEATREQWDFVRGLPLNTDTRSYDDWLNQSELDQWISAFFNSADMVNPEHREEWVRTQNRWLQNPEMRSWRDEADRYLRGQ